MPRREREAVAPVFPIEDCPEGMGEERERLGPDPLDRPRFILAARSALTQGD